MFQHIHEKLLIATLLLLPFVTSINVNFLGGVGREGSFYPLFLGVSIWLLTVVFFRCKIYLPQSWSFVALIIFLFVTVLSGLFNLTLLSQAVFQGVTGTRRYLLQTAGLGFYFTAALYLYQIFRCGKRDPLYLFRHCLLISCILSLIYTSLEIIVIFGGMEAFQLLSAIDSLFRNTDEAVFYGRVRSLTSEASYFGMYAAVVLPWVFSLFIEYNKGWKKFFSILLLGGFLLAIVLTFSRTSYVILCIEAALYIFLFRSSILYYWKQFLLAIFLLAVLGMYTFEVFMSDLSLFDIWAIFESLVGGGDGIREGSNIARYGSVAAAMDIFLEYPLFGVGFGAYGFYAPDYYPVWAWRSIEILNWSQNMIGGSWPPVHNLYVRLLAETGIFGLLTWIVFCMLLLRDEYIILKKQKQFLRIVYWRNVLITTVGIFACGFNVDGFRFFAMWILFSVVWFEYDRVLRAGER